MRCMHCICMYAMASFVCVLSGAVLVCAPDTLIRGIDEAEEYVRMHIVQARLNERGNYEVELEEHHGEGGQGHIDVAVPLSGDAAVDGDVSQGGCQTATSGNPDSAYEIDLTGATADTK